MLINEYTLEQTALSWFSVLGYDIQPDGVNPERGN